MFKKVSALTNGDEIIYYLHGFYGKGIVEKALKYSKNEYVIYLVNEVMLYDVDELCEFYVTNCNDISETTEESILNLQLQMDLH